MNAEAHAGIPADAAGSGDGHVGAGRGTAAAWAVQARGLNCRRGEQAVITALDLALAPGQLVGVFGTNGSGKTTLLQTLAGILPVGGGSLELLGQPLAAARTRIGYVAQTVPEGAFGRIDAASFVAAAWQGERWGLGLRHAAERRQATQQALHSVEAQHLAMRPMDALSGGERQRVCLAQALVNPVRLLLLDEPLSNLDPRSQQGVLALVRRLCDVQQLAVMLTAHDINPLLPVMDQVLYLAAGRGRIGTVDAVVNAESLTELYGLPMAVARHDGYVFIHPARGFMPEASPHCGHAHDHPHGHAHHAIPTLPAQADGVRSGSPGAVEPSAGQR
uniref:Putative ABC-type transport system, ATPase component n=1 Tax=mine drainage metagenome TaxID=410659 RepID=E6PUM8_9ZZZZ